MSQDTYSQPLNQIRRIPNLLQANEVLLDAPRVNKPVEDTNTSSFIVGTARTSSSERLLANNCTRAFFVVVDITGRVAQCVGGSNEGATGGRESVIKTQIRTDFLNR